MKQLKNPAVSRVVCELSQYQKEQNRLSRLYEKLVTLNSRLTAVSSPILSDSPRGGGNHINSDDLIAEKIDLEQEIEKLRKSKIKSEARIYELTNKLMDTREADVLERYYIDGENFSEIGDDMHYSVRQIERFFYNGLNQIAVCA